MASLKGNVILITGAGSGIGRATADLLASRSVLLSLADVNAIALETVQEELQRVLPTSSIFKAVVDVRSQDACSSWVADTVKHFGWPIAGAVNLAGVFGPSIAQERGAIIGILEPPSLNAIQFWSLANSTRDMDTFPVAEAPALDDIFEQDPTIGNASDPVPTQPFRACTNCVRAKAKCAPGTNVNEKYKR